MKKVLHIIGKVLSALCILLYVAVALLNYSVVQSLAGQVVGAALSEEWGGKVHVGSMSVNLMGRVGLREVQLVTPDGDTVADMRRLVVRYDENPIQADGLHLKSVYIGPTYFHLHDKDGSFTLLQFVRFLTDKLSSTDDADEESSPREHPFIVRVESVVARNIHYKQTLKDPADETSPTGIDVPDMEFTNINFKFRNVRIEPSPRITLRMDRFSAHEVSGLHVESLRMNTYVGFDGIAATNMELMTDNTQFYGDVLMSYNDFSDFKHFFDSVRFDVTFKEGTSCNMKDASYWTNTLWGMDEQIALEGVVHGPLGNFTVEQMKVAFGYHTMFRFNGSMAGLPEIDTTRFHINLQQLNTHYDDLAAIQWSETVKVPFPPFLKLLGNVAANVQFDGGIRDFKAFADVKTSVGPMKVSGEMRYDKKTYEYGYVAKLNSSSLLVSSLFPNEWVTSAGLDLSVQGKGFDPTTLTAHAEGALRNIMLRGNPLSDAHLALQAEKGLWNVEMKIDDSVANVDLLARTDFREGARKYEISGNVKRLDMASLHIWERGEDSVALLGLQLQSSFDGSDIEHVNGTLSFDNVHFFLNEDTLLLRNAMLNVKTEDDSKNITFNSDLLTLSMNGYFQYSDLPLVVRRFAVSYLPGYYTRNIMVDSMDALAFTKFHFDAKWLDTLGRLSHFVPSLSLAKNTELTLDYNLHEQLKMTLRSDSITMGNMGLHGLYVHSNVLGSNYFVDLFGHQLVSASNPIISNVNCIAYVAPENSSAHLMWKSDGTGSLNYGDMIVRMISSDTGNYLQEVHGDMDVNGDRWSLNSAGPIYFDDSTLLVQQLSLQSKGQRVLAAASLKNDSTDIVDVEFYDFRLQQLNALLRNTGFTVAGNLNGDFELRNVYTKPYFSINLEVDSTAVSGQELGTTRIASSWLPELQQVDINLTTSMLTPAGETSPIQAKGSVNLSQRDRIPLDFDILLDGFQLQIVQPLVRSAVDELQGGLRGHFLVQGTSQQPELTGKGYIDSGAVKIAVTQVRYTFTDSITFTNNEIYFDRFTLRDPNGDFAYVDGRIAHSYLKDFNLDLSLNSDKLLVMKTTARQNNYYGTLMASVSGTVKGPLDDLEIVAAARTLQGSSLVVPVTQQRSVQDLNYIHFVAPTRATHSSRISDNTSPSAFHVVADIQITSDLQLHIPVDMSPMTADIKAKGNGDLEVRVSNSAPLSVIGDYAIDNGTMGITLLGLVTKDFTIEDGSALNFPGSINAATFDIHAIHSQRVKLSSLMGATADNSQTFVQVENVINLAGSLSTPAVSFDLRLPDADQALQDEVFSYIDRTSEKDIMNQTMSLLVFNQFYSADGSDESSSDGTSMVVNTLGGVLSDMIEFANVNIDYRGATANSAGQVEMGVSREWNKFYFEGTFGYGGELRSIDDMNGVNNLTGDMLIGCKFSPMLHAYVFNRSNNNDYTRNELPYKQGVGMKFVRDYDKWRDLFRSSKKMRKQKEKAQQDTIKNDSIQVAPILSR